MFLQNLIVYRAYIGVGVYISILGVQHVCPCFRDSLSSIIWS